MTDDEIRAEIRSIVTRPMRLSDIGTAFFEMHPSDDPAFYRRFWNVSRPLLMIVPALPVTFTTYVLKEAACAST